MAAPDSPVDCAQAGETYLVPPGHIPVMNEDAVMIEFTQDTTYTNAEVQAKIDAQASVVRDLKEEQGLGNGDPEVKAAVAELLRLKALLEE